MLLYTAVLYTKDANSLWRDKVTEEIRSPVLIGDCVFYSNGLQRRSNPATVDTARSWAQDFPKQGWLEELPPFDFLTFNWLKDWAAQPEGCLWSFLAQWVPFSWSFRLP